MKELIYILRSKFENNKKVVENYFFMTFLASSALVVGLIIYPYAVRVLGKEAYGIYVFVFSNVQLFQLITTFGFDTPALKKIALFPDNREVKSRVVSEVLISKSLLFCLSLIVLTVVSRFIPFLQKHILLYYILFSLQLVEILFPTWYFQGIQKMKFVTYTNLIIRMSTIPLVFIFVHSPNDLLLYAVIVSLLPLVGGLFAFCYMLVKEDVKLRFISIRRLKSTFRNALPFFWTTAFGTVKKESLTFIVGAFFDMQSVAVLDLANKLVLIPRIIATSINGALFPDIMTNSSTDRVRRIMRYETYISLIIITLIAAFGYWAVLILGGKNMVEAYPLAIIRSITIYTWLIVDCYIYFVFIPKNRYNLIANNQLISMTCFLLLSGISLILHKSLIILMLMFVLSHVIELIYCRYAVRRYKLFD